MRESSVTRGQAVRGGLLIGAWALFGTACSAGAEGATSGSGGGGGSASGTGGLNLTGGGGGAGGLEECAGETQIADLTPVDVVIMLDQSGSMESPVGSETIWTLVTDALTEFVQTTDGEGLGVGLQYFPLPDGACTPCAGCNIPNLQITDTDSGTCCCSPPTGQSCVGDGTACPSGGLCYQGLCYSGGNNAVCTSAAYAALEVPIDALATNQASIIASLAAHGPKGLTPTGPALQGAIDAAKARAAAFPDHAVAVVFASDGVPTECSPTDIGQIAAIAQAAASGSPPVLTFVIGIGDVAALNQIAQAGGTDEAFLVSTSGSAGQQFLDALNEIKGSLLQCEFDIPQPEMGTLDYGLVNFQFSPGGGEPQLLPQVENAGACGPDGGWYYDNPTSPTKILLCPASCDTVKSFTDASIEIVLGCKTIAS